jgi:hypothetical protein
MRSRLLHLLHLLRLLLYCAAPAALAQTTSAPENAVQAALLYNFAAYTDWPPPPAETIEFCVIGSQPVFEALNNLKDKKIKGKAVGVKAITAITQAASCHVLFVGQAEHKKIQALSQLMPAHPLLLVAEENGFDLQDVVIALRKQDGRYSFKINQTAAQARALSLSSRLLKLATLVY